MKLSFLSVFFLFFFFTTPGYTQDSITFDGYTRLFYPNGKLLSEGYLKHGKPEGYWKTYSTTGILKSEGNRRNFLLDSIWIFYSNSGDTAQKISYLQGKKNGYSYEYNTDRFKPEFIGNILSKELFVNEFKEGISYYFTVNGKISELVTYRNNKRDGLSIEYDNTDGRIITIKNYIKGTLTDRERLNRFDSDGLKSGIWKTFYEDVKIHIESNFTKGVLNGYYKEYDPKGKLILTLLYNNGNLVEEVKDEADNYEMREITDLDGHIIERGPFRKEVPIGIHKTFDTAGMVISSRIYDDFGHVVSIGIITNEGKHEGDWKDLYDDGSIRASGKYVNNIRVGKWSFYFKTGSIEQIGQYSNGKENGLWQWYYPDGRLWREEEYFNGKSEGVYVEYDFLGNILVQGSYFDDEQEGDWVITINDYIEKGKFTNGFKDGLWHGYYSNGTLQFEGNFIQGNAEGKHKYFYPDGSLKEEQYYVSGIPDKNWKKFDEEGNLIVTITYEGGKDYRINGTKIDFPDTKKVIIK